MLPELDIRSLYPGQAYHRHVIGRTIKLPATERREPRHFGPLVSVLVFLPLLVIASVASLPVVPIFAWQQRRNKRLLADAMAKGDRVILWPDFVQALGTKRGTLIVEGDPRKGPNLWWTAHDVCATSPYPCSRDIGALFDPKYRPFRVWCHENYTSPTTGTALLVTGGEGQRRGFALGATEDERGSGIFEDVLTVLTTYGGRR